MTTININKGNATVDENTMKLFNNVCENIQNVGKKRFASIPLDLLYVDEYQRVDFYNEEKFRDLVEHFNPKMMGSILVSIHPEEGRFAIVDGMHRWMALREIGKYDSITCEILQDMSEDPEERKREEAVIFAEQGKWTDKLSPIAIHNAEIVARNPLAIQLDELVKKYNIEYKNNKKRGRCPENTLTGFTTARAIIGKYGKEMLDDIFYVLTESGWRLESKGFGDHILAALRNVFAYNPNTNEQKDIIIGILRNLPPKMLEAKSIATYDMRGTKAAMTLYLEDLIAAEMHIEKNFHKKLKIEEKVA